MENTCFVCGVDRFTFDTKGGGFERHIWYDHNMWNYLFMIVHLREKEPTEYNGWEQYVADKMNARDTSFFPLNNALVLREHRERHLNKEIELQNNMKAKATEIIRGSALKSAKRLRNNKAAEQAAAEQAEADRAAAEKAAAENAFLKAKSLGVATPERR